jgi:hypothetical protein
MTDSGLPSAIDHAGKIRRKVWKVNVTVGIY